MNMAKSSGERRPPSGVPDLTGVQLEALPLTMTRCWRSVKYEAKYEVGRAGDVIGVPQFV